MHETSIAMNILEIAEDHRKRYGFTEIKSISIKIGVAAGVVKDSLIFSFDILKKDSIGDRAQLIIEEIPVTGSCLDCKNDFTAHENYILSCPLCSSHHFKILSGRELDVIEMEVE